jgi:hypothetical protein
MVQMPAILDDLTINLGDPYHVKHDDEFLGHLLRRLTNEITQRANVPEHATYRYYVPLARSGHPLNRRKLEEQEGLLFLEGLAPRSLLKDMQRERRVHNLFVYCPEVLCDAHDRSDLASLAKGIRLQVSSCWDLYRAFEPLLCNRYPRIALRQQVLLGRFAEIEDRELPWLSQIFSWIGQDVEFDTSEDKLPADACLVVKTAERPAVSLPASGYASVEAALHGAIDTLCDNGNETIHKALATVAAIAVPCVCMTDVREMLQPDGLTGKEWADLVLGLDKTAGSQNSLLEVFPEPESALHWPAAYSSKARDRASVRRELELPATRLLWHPDIQRMTAIKLWGAWVDPDRGPKLRKYMRQILNALRARFRQTSDRHYRGIAMPFRLLSADPLATSGSQTQRGTSMDRAWVRCIREIRALRMRQDVAGEAALHRWLRPHLEAFAAAKERGTDDTLLVSTGEGIAILEYERLEFEFMALSGTYTTLLHRIEDTSAGRSDMRRSIWEGRLQTLKADINERLDKLGRRLHRVRERIEGFRHDQSRLRFLQAPEQTQKLVELVRAHIGATFWDAKTLIDAVLPEQLVDVVSRAVSSSTHSDEGVAGLVDQLIADTRRIVKGSQSSETGNSSKHKSMIVSIPGVLIAAAMLLLTPSSHQAAVELARCLLIKALSHLEQRLEARTYLAVRCMLTFDACLAACRLPETTFIAPLLHDIKDRIGPEGSRLLQDRICMVHHYALLTRESWFEPGMGAHS